MRAAMRRGGRGKRRSLHHCRCNMPITRCGSAMRWGRRASRRASLCASLASGANIWPGFPMPLSFPPIGPDLRWRAIAVRWWRLRSRANCMAGSWRLRARVGRACSWCCRPALPGCSRAWGRAATSPLAAPLPGAPTARWTSLWAFSSTRWCCARTVRAIPACAI